MRDLWTLRIHVGHYLFPSYLLPKILIYYYCWLWISQHCWLLSTPTISYFIYHIIVVPLPVGSSYHCCLHLGHINTNVTGESPNKSLVSNNNTPSWRRRHQAAESKRTIENGTKWWWWCPSISRCGQIHRLNLQLLQSSLHSLQQPISKSPALACCSSQLVVWITTTSPWETSEAHSKPTLKAAVQTSKCKDWIRLDQRIWVRSRPLKLWCRPERLFVNLRSSKCMKHIQFSLRVFLFVIGIDAIDPISWFLMILKLNMSYPLVGRQTVQPSLAPTCSSKFTEPPWVISFPPFCQAFCGVPVMSNSWNPKSTSQRHQLSKGGKLPWITSNHGCNQRALRIAQLVINTWEYNNCPEIWIVDTKFQSLQWYNVIINQQCQWVCQ